MLVCEDVAVRVLVGEDVAVWDGVEVLEVVGVSVLEGVDEGVLVDEEVDVGVPL